MKRLLLFLALSLVTPVFAQEEENKESDSKTETSNWGGDEGEVGTPARKPAAQKHIIRKKEKADDETEKTQEHPAVDVE